MARGGTRPGPIADHVFETGFKLAAIGGVGALVFLHLAGVLSLFNVVNFVIATLLFPVYLVFVAILLSHWLGYDTDERDLRTVSEADQDPWEDWPW